MKTILVTGANGFVGHHTLEALSAMPDIRLLAACRRPEALPRAHRATVEPGDLYDRAYRKRVLQGVDTLVNAFAWTSAWGHAGASHRHFCEPTIALIDDAVAAGVKRIVNVSSTSAAAPEDSTDPMSRGVIRGRWPHLDNVVRIENHLRDSAATLTTVVNLRLGIFAGTGYGIGLLPILLPRLKTRLVPWVAGGETSCPIIDGRDVGRAMALAATVEGLSGYESFNIVGPEVPTFRQVIDFLHTTYAYPKPSYGVPFALAYPFARLMELIDPLVPWAPLVTRSVIHLLEEVGADNDRAERRLGYRPRRHWQEAVAVQIDEMKERQTAPMPLAKPVSPMMAE